MPTPVGSWDLIACNGSGNTLANLTRHQGTSLTYVRNGVPEAQFTLSHDDPECATILTALEQGGSTVPTTGAGVGVPLLKAYRTNRDGSKSLRFHGYLASISEESGTDASSATFTFRGPLGLLLGDGQNGGDFIDPGALDQTTWTATDAGQIARDLCRSTNLIDNVNGILQASKNRDRTYLPGQNRGQALIDLTNVLDGFDFEITPQEYGFFTSVVPRPAIGILNVYAAQGSDRPAAKFEYGPDTLANCSAMHRQTLPPVTRSIGLGANGLYAGINDPNLAKYGAWRTLVNSPDVSDQQTLTDKAYALLRPNPIKTIDFTPDPRLAPLPWDDYWIGDTVRFYANRGALVEGPLSVRVNQIRVVIDPDTGLESAEIPDPVTGDEERVLRAGLQTEAV